MARLFRSLYLTAASLLLPAWATGAYDNSDATHHVFASDWGLTLKSDGTSFYNDLAQLVFSPQTGTVNYEILPYRRAKRHFFEELKSCFYPSSIEYLTTTGDIGSGIGYIDSLGILNIHLRAPRQYTARARGGHQRQTKCLCHGIAHPLCS